MHPRTWESREQSRRYLIEQGRRKLLELDVLRESNAGEIFYFYEFSMRIFGDKMSDWRNHTIGLKKDGNMEICLKGLGLVLE